MYCSFSAVMNGEYYGAASMLHTCLESLRLTLGFVFFTDVMLVFFLETVLQDTMGYCDSSGADKSSGFSFMLVIQLALMVPVVYYYHRCAMFDYVEKQSEYAVSSSSFLVGSFFSYLFSQSAILFLMVRTFLNGPAQNYSGRYILVFAVSAFAAAVIALMRFSNERL